MFLLGLSTGHGRAIANGIGIGHFRRDRSKVACKAFGNTCENGVRDGLLPVAAVQTTFLRGRLLAGVMIAPHENRSLGSTPETGLWMCPYRWQLP
jgi:hypothetical protein